MRLFGWTLIRTGEYERLKKADVMNLKFWSVYRWFSGWKDLDIIWDYLKPGDYFGDISSCREKYAAARGTNVYGQPKEKP